jgi:tripartite-type tricarboxylate transporter receptor subunit TctC
MTVVRAAPDGYTLMQASSSTMAINVSILKKMPYDPTRDLVPVALLSASPFVLVVRADSPVKSVADLLTLAKAKPGELNYGSGGPGSMHHLSTELMLSMTGTKMVHVPYKATPPALNDLLAGQIQVLFGDSTSVVPQIRQGTVRALAVTTAKRTEALPEVPTMQEAGIAGFESASWHMLVAPAGTPADIVALLNKELHTIFSDPDTIAELSRRGIGPQITESPEQLKDYVKAEIARWSPIVERAGVARTQ